MHKTVIALAIAGMAAAPAFADSNVTLYGSIDYGFGVRSGNSGLTGAQAASKQEFVSGVDQTNRLGFKGAEDLGNGTKAIFELEMGFLADTGENNLPNNGISSGSGLFRNHSWVGLTGDWGTAVGGRVDGSRYSVSAKYDPFAGGTVATPLSLNGQVTRGDNAIAYITPNVEGLYAVLAYTTSLVGQEAFGNNGDIRLWLIQTNYVKGPFSGTFNFEHATVHNDPNDTKINIYQFGASYDFGVAKVSGMWEHVKTDGNAQCTSGVICDEDTWFIGGSVPITEKDTVRAVYADYKDKSAAADSCGKWGIGAEHYLSKRTNFYVDYAQVNQHDNGHCTIYYNAYTASADAGTGSADGGVGTRGFDVGIVHRF